MSIAHFVRIATIERPGAGVALSDLRRAYAAQYGMIGRTEFLAGLAAAGIATITPEGRPTYVVGRAMAPQPAAA
jgi:hypothetical protein